MPNWCAVDFGFYGDEKAITDLADKLDTKDNCKLSEVARIFDIDPDTVQCRGYITGSCYDESKDIFYVSCDMAWGPNTELFDEIIFWKYSDENRDPRIRYVYIAEEPNCDVFVNTDESGEVFPTRYRVQITPYSEEDPVEEYFKDVKEVVEFLNKKFSLDLRAYTVREVIKGFHKSGISKNWHLSIDRFELE